MAKALKIMTWNVQQLPGPFGAGEAEARAARVARAVLDLPPREQPDIVAFNEVFDEDARRRLLRMLKPVYPHFVKKLEHPTIDVEEDSGLMLFSKLPFLPLPTGGHVFFEPFRNASGTDALASKGVGVVRVSGPFEPTTIAFTHTQASDDTANAAHAQIRGEQIEFIRQVLLQVAAGDLQHFANSLVLGDLNVKGDSADTTGELNKVFSGAPDSFGGDFDDGWRLAMHPPKDNRDHDPGFTQRDTSSSFPNRLDYQCTRLAANVDIGLVPHQMSIPVRLGSNVTDHFALYAHLHRLSPHCTPATAVELLRQPIHNASAGGSPVRLLETQFRDEDMFHWVFIDSPGTFSTWLSSPLEVAAFRRSDFTNALEPSAILSVTELPPPLQIALGASAIRAAPFPKGSVFSSREPFFLRIRGASASFQGAAAFAVLEHKGESPASAFVLQPHLRLDPRLPLGQPLGLKDECYFRVERPNRFAQTPYQDRFVLDNGNETRVILEVRDTNQVPIGRVSGSQAELTLERTAGKESIFLVLQRSNLANTQLGLTWVSPLTFVALDESLRLHVDSETGLTDAGEDEFELSVNVDGVNVFFDSWDDADADEDWPDLAERVRTSIQNRLQAFVKSAAFTDGIVFDVIKTDGIAAQGSRVGIIQPLAQRDLEKETRTARIDIPASLGDGRLTARADLSKFSPF